MLAALQILADRVARAGLGRRATVARRPLGDPDQGWRLTSEPALWPLWMPGVLDLRDPDRAPRPGARYRVGLRARKGRLGLGATGEGHVVVDAYEPDRHLAWRLLAGGHEERYAVRRHGAGFVVEAAGGSDAERVLAELDRQSGPPD